MDSYKENKLYHENVNSKEKKYISRKNLKGEPKITKRLSTTANPSKRYRDRLNTEIENLARLLPFPSDVVSKLDKLSLLRLVVSYIKSKGYLKGDSNLTERITSFNYEDSFWQYFKQGFDGFILVITLDGQVFFVSDNVKHYLGYSQWQILQQPFEILVPDDDKKHVISLLKGKTLTEADEQIGNHDTKADSNESLLNQYRDFVVRLKCNLVGLQSGIYKPFRLYGTIREIQTGFNKTDYALVGLCTPAKTCSSILEVTMKFTFYNSKHRVDYGVLDIDMRGKDRYGFTTQDIYGKMSYEMLHPDDLHHARCRHSEVLLTGKSSIGIIRLRDNNDEFSWVQYTARMVYKKGKPDFIVSTCISLGPEDTKDMMKHRDKSDLELLSRLGLKEPIKIINPSPASVVLKLIQKMVKQTSIEKQPSIFEENSNQQNPKTAPVLNNYKSAGNIGNTNEPTYNKNLNVAERNEYENTPLITSSTDTPLIDCNNNILQKSHFPMNSVDSLVLPNQISRANVGTTNEGVITSENHNVLPKAEYQNSSMLTSSTNTSLLDCHMNIGLNSQPSITPDKLKIELATLLNSQMENKNELLIGENTVFSADTSNRISFLENSVTNIPPYTNKELHYHEQYGMDLLPSKISHSFHSSKSIERELAVRENNAYEADSLNLNSQSEKSIQKVPPDTISHLHCQELYENDIYFEDTLKALDSTNRIYEKPVYTSQRNQNSGNFVSQFEILIKDELPYKNKQLHFEEQFENDDLVSNTLSSPDFSSEILSESNIIGDMSYGKDYGSVTSASDNSVIDGPSHTNKQLHGQEHHENSLFNKQSLNIINSENSLPEKLVSRATNSYGGYSKSGELDNIEAFGNFGKNVPLYTNMQFYYQEQYNNGLLKRNIPNNVDSSNLTQDKFAFRENTIYVADPQKIFSPFEISVRNSPNLTNQSQYQEQHETDIFVKSVLDSINFKSNNSFSLHNYIHNLAQ